MSLPADWTQVPVTGTFVFRNGDPLAGKRITFESDQVVTIGGEVIVPKRLDCTLDDTGSVPTGFTLPSTNDPDLNVTGWAYTVKQKWPGGQEFDIFVPYDSAGIDLATVSPAVDPDALTDIETAAMATAVYQAATTAAAAAEASATAAAASAATMVVEYGVVLVDDTGIPAGGYPAARSVPRPQTMTRFFAEVIAGTEATVSVLVNGLTVHGPVTVTTTQTDAINVALAEGDEVTFDCLFTGVTRFWAQVDGVAT